MSELSSAATEFFALIRNKASDAERFLFLAGAVKEQMREAEWLEFKYAGHLTDLAHPDRS